MKSAFIDICREPDYVLFQYADNTVRFEEDSDFFYIGLGGPTTHITNTVSAVGNILRLPIGKAD